MIITMHVAPVTESSASCKTFSLDRAHRSSVIQNYNDRSFPPVLSKILSQAGKEDELVEPVTKKRTRAV